MALVLYSFLLGAVLAVSAPVWGWRMARNGRYRAGLRQRLGHVPAALQTAVQGRRVVWVHAVSVGEVLAAERLIHELCAALGSGWIIVISTTTATGQTIARERFGADRVFYWPVDFGWIVKRFLRVLQPEMLVLVESELWPRMLAECRHAGVPVAVVNARMSDRSFRRAMQTRRLWQWMAGGVTAFFAQGEETATRLRTLGARDMRMLGNLKFDLQTGGENAVAGSIRSHLQGRRLVVAGSTLPGEETLLLEAWPDVLQTFPDAVLLLAPRHPPRFEEVFTLMRSRTEQVLRVSTDQFPDSILQPGAAILLDTLGDLSSVYGVADVAFVGGSLVPKGGHNPLEAARFGVPVLMGPSYENFREIVEAMFKDDAIAVVQPEKLGWALGYLLGNEDEGIGERGRIFFLSQAGATARTITALREMLDA